MSNELQTTEQFPHEMPFNPFLGLDIGERWGRELGSIDSRLGRIEGDILQLGYKVEVLDGKIDTVAEKLDAKIDGVAEKLDAKIDGVAEKLDAKIDAVAARLDTKIDGVAEKLDAKIDAVAARLDNKVDTKFDQLDTKFSEKFDQLDAKFSTKFDQLDTKFSEKFENLDNRIDKWALVTSRLDERMNAMEKRQSTHSTMLIGLWVTVIAGFILQFLK